MKEVPLLQVSRRRPPKKRKMKTLADMCRYRFAMENVNKELFNGQQRDHGRRRLLSKRGHTE